MAEKKSKKQENILDKVREWPELYRKALLWFLIALLFIGLFYLFLVRARNRIEKHTVEKIERKEKEEVENTIEGIKKEWESLQEERGEIKKRLEEMSEEEIQEEVESLEEGSFLFSN